MTPVNQTIFKNDNANCMQAVVASYLDLPIEDVPNFATFRENEDCWDAFELFMKGYGYQYEGYVEEDPPEESEYYIGYLLWEEEDDAHVVICKGKTIVHDPHPDGPYDEDKIDGYISLTKIE